MKKIVLLSIVILFLFYLNSCSLFQKNGKSNNDKPVKESNEVEDEDYDTD